MFGLEGAEPGFPGGLEGLAAFEPCPVDAVAGAVGVAVPDALEGEEEVGVVAGFGFSEGVGEMAGGIALDSDEVAFPGVGGPIGGGEEDGFVAGLAEGIGETEEVALGSPGGGVAAADEGELHGKLKVES